MKRYLTVDDLVDMFSKHRNTVYGWIHGNVFPNAFRVKDGWFVPSSDIHRLMQAGKRKKADVRTESQSVNARPGFTGRAVSRPPLS